MDKMQRLSYGQSDAVAFMSRHFVALICTVEAKNRDGSVVRGDEVYSGFLMILADRLYWVTAGHCLKGLDKRIRRREATVVRCSLMDCFGWEARHLEPIPFAYELDRGVYLDDGKLGMDFALVPLDGNTCDLLAANKVKAIGRRTGFVRRKWNSTSTACSVFRGTARCAPQSGGDEGIQMRTVLIAVDRLEPSAVSNASSADWFIGRINPEVTIETIEGMSGGPIYGFRRTPAGQLVYHVVALQSRWRPESRIIFGCNVRLFAEESLRMLVGRQRDHGDDGGTKASAGGC